MSGNSSILSLRYPNNLVWQLNTSRQVLRKYEKWQQFHKFLVAETEAVPLLTILLLFFEICENIFMTCHFLGIYKPARGRQHDSTIVT